MYQQPNIPQYGYYAQQQMRPQPPVGLKGRPVSSLDEVRATAVDFDGSIFYFPNLANDKIYTKQVNLDGTSSVKVYELVVAPEPIAVPIGSQEHLVTKEEFTNTVNNLFEEISALKHSMNAGSVSTPENQEENILVKPQTAGFNF